MSMELITQGSAKAMFQVVYRLALLCKASRLLTPEVHQMVREYLVIRLGVISPLVDELLWRSIQEWGDFYFVLTGSVPPENRTIVPIRGQYHIMYEKAANADEEQIVVRVALDDRDATACTWCMTLPWDMLVIESRVTIMLEDCRRQIDNRDIGHQAVVEAPWTSRQWQTFCQLWLFGPPVPAQTT